LSLPVLEHDIEEDLGEPLLISEALLPLHAPE
jgi:hypothetical protein